MKLPVYVTWKAIDKKDVSSSPARSRVMNISTVRNPINWTQYKTILFPIKRRMQDSKRLICIYATTPYLIFTLWIYGESRDEIEKLPSIKMKTEWNEKGHIQPVSKE